VAAALSGGGRLFTLAQQAADRGHVVGLRQVLVEPRGCGPGPIGRSTPPGCGGEVAAASALTTERFCHFVAIDIGKLDIEQDEMRIELTSRSQRIGATVNCMRLMTEQAQQHRECFGRSGMIINNEHALHRSRRTTERANASTFGFM